MEHEVQFGVNSIPSLYMVCDDDLPFVPILSNLTVYPPLSLSLLSSQLFIDRYGCHVSHLLMERIEHVMRFDWTTLFI